MITNGSGEKNQLLTNLTNYLIGRTPLGRLAELFLRLGITSRIMVSFLIITMTAFLASGAFSFIDNRSNSDDKLTISKTAIQQIANSIEVETSNLLKVLNFISIDPTINEIGQPDFTRLSDSDKETKLKSANSIISQVQKEFGQIVEIEVSLPKSSTNLSIGADYLVKMKTESAVSQAIKQGMTSKINNVTICVADLPQFKNSILYVNIPVKAAANSTEINGEIHAFVDSAYLVSIVNAATFGKNSNTFISDNLGTLIASQQPITVEKGSLITPISNYNEKTLFQKTVGQFTYLAYKISGTNWFVASKVPAKLLGQNTSSFLQTLLITLVIVLLIAFLLALIISDSIRYPLTELTNILDEATGGKLNVQFKPFSNDEISTLGSHLEKTLNNVFQVVDQLKKSVHNVLSTSSQITSSLQLTFTTTEQVACSTSDISKDVTCQSVQVTESLKGFSELSNNINQFGDEISQVSTIAKSTKNLSVDSLLTLNTLKEKTLETNKVSEAIKIDIDGLNDEMKQVKRIVKLMVDISDKTKLLSLNAAIEAARAGDAGLGFAVVAQEVQDLATKTMNELETINDIIASIQKRTLNAVNNASNVTIAMKHQMDAVFDTENTVRTILRTMDNISEKVIAVDHSITNIIFSKDTLIEAIRCVSSDSLQTVTMSQQASLSTNELKATATALSRMAKDLSCDCTNLIRSVDLLKMQS